MNSPEPYWNRIGSDWSLIAPPLRPCAEDTVCMERMVRDWYGDPARGSLRAGVLGVTPEIVCMNWPEQARITAFDKEPAMIGYLWPKSGLPHATPLCCNWLSLPIADAGLDVVAGDGSLTQLSFPDEHQGVARELARVVAPGGILVLRLFVPPLERESVDTVFDELRNGRMVNCSAFRWRLLMSLQECPEKGICVGEAWEVWHSRIPSPELLAESLGWPIEAVRVIDRYRSATAVYTFTSLETVRALLEPAFFMTERVVPSYQEGIRYPTVCFRRR
ncbi:MAG: class I SAM-dependent methyltransferase [Geobacteraceae bacterium]|nr:class I SAM-dependent methyltransferase [Geobacteraceae bacterium]